MKTKFENSIKESLDQFELPYDANAWTALSKKLDLVQPVSSPKSNMLSTGGKWFLAAGIVTIAATITYMVVNNNSKEQDANTKTTLITETKSTAEDLSSTVNKNIDLKSIGNSSEGNNEIYENHPEKFYNTAKIAVDRSKTNHVVNSNTDENILLKYIATDKNMKSGGNIANEPHKPPLNVAVIIPKVSDVCSGEILAIKNENNFDLFITGPNKEYNILKNSSAKFEFKESGHYEVYNRTHLIANFNVNPAPKVDFIIDDQVQFEDGLPSTKVQSYADASSFVWNCEKSTKTGKTATFHFFTKGSHEITLKSNSDKGCTSEITKTVEISSDYNLFSPNAFEPNNSDSRRNRFIPNALLVRDTPFTMIIVDPKTGVTLFTSSNAQDGWDGIDKNTGELVEEATYVWKVFLKKPILGEKSEYSGIVFRK
jgi:hypothetical protein